MKRVWKYVTAAGIGGIIFLVAAISRGAFGFAETKEVVRVLSDSAFLSGVLLTGAGLLLFCADGGLFDMFAYGAVLLVCTFKRNVRDRKYRDFYEYREAKKENRKGGFGFLLLTGIFFLALATIFLALYYRI